MKADIATIYYYLRGWIYHNGYRTGIMSNPGDSLDDLSQDELLSLYDTVTLMEYHEEVNRIFREELSIPSLSNAEIERVELELYYEDEAYMRWMSSPDPRDFPEWATNQYI